MFDEVVMGILAGLGAAVPSGIIGLAVYVLTSLSLYTIAQRRGLHAPWLAWIPVAVYAFAFDYFIQGTILWVAGYYSVAFGVNLKIMEKPFQRLTENFVSTYEAEHGEIVLDEEK